MGADNVQGVSQKRGCYWFYQLLVTIHNLLFF
jgi:hypothetical protein